MELDLCISEFYFSSSFQSVNRTLVTWLKLWDECVFKRKAATTSHTAGVNEKEREMFAMDSGKPRRPHFRVGLGIFVDGSRL